MEPARPTVAASTARDRIVLVIYDSLKFPRAGTPRGRVRTVDCLTHSNPAGKQESHGFLSKHSRAKVFTQNRRNSEISELRRADTLCYFKKVRKWPTESLICASVSLSL